MAPGFFFVALTLLGSSTQPATSPSPLRLPGGGFSFDQVVRNEEPSTPDPDFRVVDWLPPHDDFYSNMLVGDADHDHRQEIVIRHEEGSFGFYEDDGTGDFHRVKLVVEGEHNDLLAMGDVDGDELTDLFFKRANGCASELVRMEASSPFGFPDHVVWTAPMGNQSNFRATIADVDGDGVLELVTSDNDVSCGPDTVKVFESAPGDQMNLILNHPLNYTLGNPVVADFDLDGRKEIIVAEGTGGRLDVFEGIADDTIVYAGFLPQPMGNAYGLALVDAFSPDGRPIAFHLGGTRVRSYEMFADNVLSLMTEIPVPGYCGVYFEIDAADLFGTSTAEIIVGGCDPAVAIYTVDVGGALVVFDLPVVADNFGVAGTHQTRVHSGAIAVPRYGGNTAVLELVHAIPPDPNAARRPRH